MVPVSLELLVSLPGTRPVWPADFAALIAKLEQEPNDVAQRSALADWCQEHDEPGLARAFAWLAKRPTVELVQRNERYQTASWGFVGLPAAVEATSFAAVSDSKTAAGAVAQLAHRLREVLESLT